MPHIEEQSPHMLTELRCNTSICIEVEIKFMQLQGLTNNDRSCTSSTMTCVIPVNSLSPYHMEICGAAFSYRTSIFTRKIHLFNSIMIDTIQMLFLPYLLI